MRLIILCVILTACGQEPPLDTFQKDTCDKHFKGSIDPFFVPYMEHVQEKLTEYGGEDLPVERLGAIYSFNFVSKDYLDSRFGPSRMGVNVLSDCEGRLYSEIVVKEQKLDSLQLKMTIYHEIMHIYFNAHNADWSGLMSPYIKPEKALTSDLIEEFLEQTIFDSTYKSRITQTD